MPQLKTIAMSTLLRSRFIRIRDAIQGLGEIHASISLAEVVSEWLPIRKKRALVPGSLSCDRQYRSACKQGIILDAGSVSTESRLDVGQAELQRHRRR